MVRKWGVILLHYYVEGQKIRELKREVVASGQINFTSIRFEFSQDWNGLHKVVQFTQHDKTYNLDLGTDKNTCGVPMEIRAGHVCVSVFGYSSDCDNALRATTAPITICVKKSGFDSEGKCPVPPTPDLYAQLLSKIDEKIETMQDGYSPTANVTPTEKGCTITIKDKNGTTTADVFHGDANMNAISTQTINQIMEG